METIYVRLSGWQTARAIIQEADNVLFEVAEDEHHCSICASRIAHVQAMISQKSLAATFIRRPTQYSQRTVFVSLPACPEGQDVRQYVADALSLPIII